MKRSEINASIREMEAMINECRFALPPFCHFTPEEWQEKGHEYDEIRDNMLGWDITDYGLGNFDKIGFSLITLRNGNMHNSKYTKTYAEKLLYLRKHRTPQMRYIPSKGQYTDFLKKIKCILFVTQSFDRIQLGSLPCRIKSKHCTC